MAISLKRVKREEKLLRNAYRNSPTLFRTVPSPTLYGLPFPKIGIRTRTAPRSSIAIISRTGKATDFKFSRYIYRVHPNKGPLKICNKMERGHIPGVPNFSGYPLLSKLWEKLRTSNFAYTFIGCIGINPIKNVGKVSMGVGRKSRTFSGHPYIGHIACSSLR